ncbi:MAG: hypothetical protein ACR2K4_10635 [Candidatus Limnocylindria bacterium]
MFVPARSLFNEVSRLVARENRLPAEDRLTECVGAVLRRWPELGLTMAQAWLDPLQQRAGGGERVSATGEAADALSAMPADALRRVRTQVVVEGGRVDLELWFSPEADAWSDAVVVRVEVKHGSDPHSDQLRTYQRTLPATSNPHAVVLLASRARLPYEYGREIPPSVPQRSWQQTARLIAKQSTEDPVQDWLRDEFCTYLREEQLMDPEALRPEHLTALAYMDEATTSLALVTERASEYLRSADALGAPSAEDHAPRSPFGIGYSGWWYEPPGWDTSRWKGALRG